MPIEVCGKEVTQLDYEVKSDCEEGDETLSCSDLSRLADAIQGNDKFVGPLNLENQPLTDISGLHIGRILSRGHNITKLCLAQKPSKCKYTHKTGEYVGGAILKNPECGLVKLDFKGIYLGESGLQRVIEAANDCKTIEKLDVGVVTDSGLRILAEQLKPNCSLEELTFAETEDQQKQWSGEACAQFAGLLREHTKLKSVKAKFAEERGGLEGSRAFKHEIEFYTEQKDQVKKKEKKMRERMQSCDTDHMFETMSKHIENTDKNEKMPVRKFFNNTFDQLLNDAIFALQKTKSKATGHQALQLQFHAEQVKFVANYLQNKLPEGELAPEEQPEPDDN